MDSGGQGNSQTRLKVALVAMPWPIFNRPSVQLATLKSFIAASSEGIRVDTWHPYLEVAKILGNDQYHAISQNIWISEALYGAICFPEQLQSQERLVAAQLRKTNLPGPFDFVGVVAKLVDHLGVWSRKIDWSSYDLIGFSVCFSQLLATLAAVRSIKALHPGIPVVLGGSICAPQVGISLLMAFPEVDYIITGEGELPLLQLCRVLAGDSDKLPDRVYKANRQEVPSKNLGRHLIQHKDQSTVFRQSDQLKDLSCLPAPDYRDYFAELKTVFNDQPFIPELPVEFSRGCWWGKCTFCNLNLQWTGYRAKSALQMINEIKTLTARYGTLDFSFTDNVLPVAEAKLFFAEMADTPCDFRFFAEIRVDQRGERLAAMAAGGLTMAQAGIEALSDSLLRRLGKGATVFDNIALLRDAQEMGVDLDGNLITEFPGSTQTEVDQTLEALDFVLPFRPLVTASFFLGLGSLVERDPKQYGVRRVGVHPNIKRIFPKSILSNHNFLILGWQGDRQQQKKLWQPVVDRVEAWGRFHRQRRNRRLPPLTYRDGGEFLIVRQELPDQAIFHHRLRGLSRRIYLHCRETKDLAELEKDFPAQNRERLSAFLADLVRKKLLFSMGDKFLALAVHSHGR